MNRIDPILSEHLETHGVPYMQFAFRWMNCLLMRELPLHAIIRLWDSWVLFPALVNTSFNLSLAYTLHFRYLAEDAGFEALHLYVCAAFMKTFAQRVLATQDMSEIMLLVLNLPTEHWTESDSALLLAEAYVKHLYWYFVCTTSHALLYIDSNWNILLIKHSIVMSEEAQQHHAKVQCLLDHRNRVIERREGFLH